MRNTTKHVTGVKASFVTSRTHKEHKELDRGYTVILFPEVRELTFAPAKIFAINSPVGGQGEATIPEVDVESTPIGVQKTLSGLTAAGMANVVNGLDLRDGGLLVLFT